MSSISSVSSSIYSSALSSSTRSSRTGNSSKMAEDLFAQLDTTGKGYIEKSDLENAFSALSSSTSSTSSATSSDSSASVDDVFAKLDSDSDGKVTESELASGLENLASALDGQYNQMRMNGGMPPPPPQNDEGFTQDELTQQLSELSSSGSTDSARSDLLTKIVANFDAADANSDGKVSFDEAMAYDQSSSATSSSASATSTSTTSATASSDSGFTLEELQDQLSEIGSSDSTRADLMSRIIANFDAADTNGDGKVSNAEAMAYDQSSSTSSSTSVAAVGSSSASSSSSSSTSSGDSSSSSGTASSELAILKRIMDLMQSYASNNATSSSTLSVSA